MTGTGEHVRCHFYEEADHNYAMVADDGRKSCPRCAEPVRLDGSWYVHFDGDRL